MGDFNERGENHTDDFEVMGEHCLRSRTSTEDLQ